MAKPRYCLSNFLAAAVITPSSADIAFPVTNLFSRRSSKPFRFIGKIDENLVIDLGAIINVTVVALVNHNLTAGAVVTIEANSVNAWVTPPLSYVIPWSQKNAALFFDATYRYWRIRIKDPTNSATALQIGELILSVWGELPYFSYGFVLQDQYLNLQNQTSYKQKWVSQQGNMRGLTLTFDSLSITDVNALRTIFAATVGGSVPWLLFPDGSSTECFYVNAPDLIKYPNSGSRSFNCQIEVWEQNAGFSI